MPSETARYGLQPVVPTMPVGCAASVWKPLVEKHTKLPGPCYNAQQGSHGSVSIADPQVH